MKFRSRSAITAATRSRACTRAFTATRSSGPARSAAPSSRVRKRSARRYSPEENGMKPYAKELSRLADGYRRAEQAVVPAYFGQPRDQKRHLHWLKAQAFKE